MDSRLNLRVALLISASFLNFCTPKPKSPEGAESQIVGGTGAEKGQFPGLVYLPGIACTAAKIRSQYFLTAKHCIVESGTKANTTLSFAIGNQMESLQSQSLMLTNVVTFAQSDVGILKVQSDPLNWPQIALTSRKISAEKLSASSPITVRLVGYGCTARRVKIPGVEFSLAGGGGAQENLKTKSDSETAELRYVDAVIGKASPFKFTIPPLKIAAPNNDKGILPGLCPGDSGGPLLIQNGKKWEVIGVNSGYHQLTGENYFARVDKGSSPEVLQWLADNLK